MSQSAILIKAPDDSTSTASVLLDTAEVLFAQKGIENVSIRQIVIASGHGNLSGAHYHFGTREELIRRLIERRMEVVDKIRHAKLDEVVNAGLEDDVSAIIAAAVNVLVDVVRLYSWGPDYVLVIAQAMFNPKIQFFTTIDLQAVSGNTRTTAMLRRLAPSVPKAKFDKRMGIVFHETVYSFSRWFQSHGAITKLNQKSFQTMVASVSEFMAGGILAPVLGKLEKKQ